MYGPITSSLADALRGAADKLTRAACHVPADRREAYHEAAAAAEQLLAAYAGCLTRPYGAPSEPEGHTAEPWSVIGSMPLQITAASGDRVAKPLANGRMAVDEYRANARRIVACVNACAGIPTADLERMA